MSNIIFDFDGTIADTFGVVADLFYTMTRRTEPMPAQEIERLRGMTLREVASDLKIKPWKVPFLVARGRANMRAQMGRVTAFEGMPEIIKSLHAQGHSLYIMSSNSVQNIQPFLEKYDMNTEFIKIYGGIGIFGKPRVLKKVMRENDLELDTTYYIGDEARDVEAAKHVDMKIIAVSWGYNNAKILSEHKPTLLAHKPADILQFFTA